MWSLILKTWTDQRKSTFWWAFGIVVLCIVQLSVYPSIRESAESLQKFLDLYPDALKKIFRMQDYTSGPGYLSTELFSLVLPLLVISVGASAGARASAQEEEDGTADILFTMPMSRYRILLSKVIANLTVLVVIGSIIFAVLAIGSPFVDLRISSWRLFAGVLNCMFIGVAFGSLATMFGALSGRRGMSLGIATGMAVAFYVLFSLAGLVESFEHLLPVNPFQWAIGDTPLFNGFDWPGISKLVGFSLVCFGVSFWGIQNRDIRA